MKRLFLFIIAFSLAAVPALFAKFKVGPSYFEVSLNPGERREKAIFLENPYKKSMTLLVEVEDFPNFSRNRNIKPADWLGLKKMEVVVPKKSKKLLKFKMTAPKGLKGEVAAKIGIMEKGQGDAMIHTRMIVVVYLISLDGSIISADMNSFEASRDKEKDISFKMVLKNSGNIHIRPKGVLEIINAKGRSVKKVKLAEILPLFEEQEGTLKNEEALKDLPDGEYTVKSDISIGYDKKFNLVNEFSMSVAGEKISIKLIK